MFVDFTIEIYPIGIVGRNCIGFTMSLVQMWMKVDEIKAFETPPLLDLVNGNLRLLVPQNFQGSCDYN
jgi:hypothetical protein